MDVQAPPAAYVRPYDGSLYILQLTMNRVGIVCRMIGLDAIDGAREIHACAQVKPSACLVVLPTDVGAADRAALLDHEMAHCNGWRHDG